VNKKIIVIGCGALVAVCLCVVVIGVVVGGTSLLGVLGLTQPIADTGDKFMQSLKAADYDSAYALMAPALQKKVGTVQGLRKMIETNHAQPTQWTFIDRNITGDQGRLTGSVTMQSGPGTLSLEMAKTGEDWKITAFDLKPK